MLYRARKESPCPPAASCCSAVQDRRIFTLKRHLNTAAQTGLQHHVLRPNEPAPQLHGPVLQPPASLRRGVDIPLQSVEKTGDCGDKMAG